MLTDRVKIDSSHKEGRFLYDGRIFKYQLSQLTDTTSRSQFYHLNVAGSHYKLCFFHQELLSEMIRGEDEKSCVQRLCRLTVHLMAWAMCLASICLGAMAVHYLSEVRGDGASAAVQPYVTDFMHTWASIEACLTVSQDYDKNNQPKSTV